MARTVAVIAPLLIALWATVADVMAQTDALSIELNRLEERDDEAWNRREEAPERASD